MDGSFCSPDDTFELKFLGIRLFESGGLGEMYGSGASVR